jgi:hypothetical protein
MLLVARAMHAQIAETSGNLWQAFWIPLTWQISAYNRDMKTFDEELWRSELAHPDWYLRLKDELRRVTGQGPEAVVGVRDFIQAELAAGRIALGKSGPNWDQDRQPIDTVVIHHTSAGPGYDLGRMNAVQLINLYASYYASPVGAPEVKGQPIWSNHVRRGKQVFWAYHWLIRADGTAERLLEDSEIGWQAGDWEVNKRSVAICFDGDFNTTGPTRASLRTAGKLLKEAYPQVGRNRVWPHRQINDKTTCPGQNMTLDDLLTGVRSRRG